MAELALVSLALAPAARRSGVRPGSPGAKEPGAAETDPAAGSFLCGALLPGPAQAQWRTQLRSQGVRPVPTPSTRVAPGHTRDRTRACAQMHAKFNNPALATN